MTGTGSQHQPERRVIEDGRRVDDIERHLYGNGRAGLLERFSNMEGYQKGVAVGGTIVASIILAILMFVLNSVANIERAVVRSGPSTQQTDTASIRGGK
jgi:hypothetical protein